MDKSLKNYVLKKLHSGVSENIIRHNLEKAGWSEEDIDKAFKKASTHKKNKNVVGILAAIILLGFAIALIVTISTYDSELDSQTESEDSLETENNQPIQETLSDNCLEESEYDQKHECYLEKVRAEFDCEQIEDSVEKNYCYRALEDYYQQ